jgi:hypothetical protein
MELPTVTDRDVERVLARLLVGWAAAGVLLTAFWGVLWGALWLLGLGFWIGYALAGAILNALCLQHIRHATSRPAGLALAAGVPAVAAGLWHAAGLLRAGGYVVAAWASAI